MIKKLFLLAFLATFIFGEVITSSTVKTSIGQGYGANYEEALNNAIKDALGRMNGVKMSADTVLKIDSIKDQKSKNFKKEYSEQIIKSTNGKFDSYEVLSKSKEDDNIRVDVKIKKTITTKKYKAPGLDPNNRRKIAIVPGYSKNGFVIIDNEKVPSQFVADDITKSLTSYMTRTRKFTVLDRLADDAYNKEVSILLSSNAAKDEGLKLGQVLGSDYLLVFSIDDFKISDMEQNHITAVSNNKKTAAAKVHYQVILTALRQVKFANDVSIKLTSNDVYKDIISKIAQNITTEIIDAIYPLKISLVDGDKIIITQPLNLGDEYEILRSDGKKAKDPYTHESVRVKGTHIGTAKVIMVEPKMSYLSVQNGKPKVGDIVRIIQNKNINEGAKPTVKQTEQGGVILPF